MQQQRRYNMKTRSLGMNGGMTNVKKQWKKKNSQNEVYK